MKKILAALLICTSLVSCSSIESQETYILEGVITSETIAALDTIIDQPTILILKDSPGGYVPYKYNSVTKELTYPFFEKLRKSNITTIVTGKCVSACAMIALNSKNVIVKENGQICPHGITAGVGPFSQLIYRKDIYETLYRNVSKYYLKELFYNFPEAVCLPREELNHLNIKVR